MAYHIHNCPVHIQCILMVNQNNKFKTHFHVTNLHPSHHEQKNDTCLKDTVD